MAEFKKDFGTIAVEEDIHPSTFPLRGVVRTFMKKNGYDIKHNEVHIADANWIDKQVEIIFRFVHENVTSVDFEPKYKVIFVEK